MAEGLIQPTQIQFPDIAGGIIEGYTQGQNLQLRQLQMQGLQQEQAKMEQQQIMLKAQNQLKTLAAAGDQQALQKLAAFDPEGAKGIQNEMNRKVVRVGQLAMSVKNVPLANRPRAYEYAKRQAELEGYDVSDWPDQYDKGLDTKLDFLVNSARDIEKVKEDPKLEAEIGQIKSQTAENYANISKTKAETQKINRELSGQKPMSGDEAKVSTIAQGGISAVADLTKLINETPGGVSRLAADALLPNTFQNEETQKFEVARKDLSDLLGRLRSGGQISPNEEVTYKKLIPEFGDRKGTKNYKLKRLNEIFTNIDTKLRGRPSTTTGGGQDPLGLFN